MLGNAGLPPQAAFVTLPSGRWKRKDAESAPTCRSRVFVRRATAKAGDRYKKRGLCCRRVLRRAGSFFCASGPLEREEGVLLCRIEFGASAAAGVPGIVHRESAFVYSTVFSRAAARSAGRRGERPASGAAVGFGPVLFRIARERICSVSASASALRCRSRQTGRFLPASRALAAQGDAAACFAADADLREAVYGLRQSK